MNNNVKIEVEWTGAYPNLCAGEWIIKINNKKINIPEELRYEPMDTRNNYNRWRFDENYSEEWDTYTDGLTCKEWIRDNYNWIMQIFKDVNVEVKLELLEILFEKIREEDWRHGSCGGCI